MLYRQTTGEEDSILTKSLYAFRVAWSVVLPGEHVENILPNIPIYYRECCMDGAKERINHVFMKKAEIF
jgi:hypothetical protein